MSRRAAAGFTLIELLVASAIMVIIGTISYQTLDRSIESNEILREHMAKLARIDRAWLLLENDLRNVLSQTRRQVYGLGSGEELPPLSAENSADEYWLTLLRGGHANPLNFNRSELIRVGYRLEDETLWRDVWYDTASTDQEQAQRQKIIDEVERIEIRVLSKDASSLDVGPWLDRWPQQQQQVEGVAEQLPLAIEITLELKGQSEIKRLYGMVKGE